MRKISINKAISEWGSYTSVSDVKRRLEQSKEVIRNVKMKLQFDAPIPGTEWAYSLGIVDWNSSYWKDDTLFAYTIGGTRLSIDLAYARSDMREVASKVRGWIRDQRDDERHTEREKTVSKAVAAEDKAKKAVSSAERALVKAKKDYEKAQGHAQSTRERVAALSPSKWSPEAKAAQAQRRKDARAWHAENAVGTAAS